MSKPEYAIFKSGSKQYQVSTGDVVDVELLEGETGTAMNTIDDCVRERLRRFNVYADERGISELLDVNFEDLATSPPDVNWRFDQEYTYWVSMLDPQEKSILREWLRGISSAAKKRMQEQVGI